MLSLLRTPPDGHRIYSFGKITAKLSPNRYELAFHAEKIVIETAGRFNLNSWVRVYGTFTSGVLRVIFIGRLDAVDINLLERAVAYMEKHLEGHGAS